MGKDELSSSEALIMKVIWDAGGDISVPDLMRTLKEEYDKDYARTTIATFMLRLSDKRFATTRREGKISFAVATKTEQEYLDALASKETRFWFKGCAANYISALHRSGSLSEEDRKKIREYLDELND